MPNVTVEQDQNEELDKPGKCRTFQEEETVNGRDQRWREHVCSVRTTEACVAGRYQEIKTD